MQLFVWDLDRPHGGAALLSDHERARAARFAVPRQGARFVAARAGLRRILAQWLGQDPACLRFGVGAHGKPHLEDFAGAGFNLTHCDHLAALVVGHGMALGVDIERIRPVSPGLARRFFAPAEAAALDRVAPALQEAAFHACWTRKEATIKAIGTGLATKLDSFAVSIDDPARLLWLDGAPDAARHWQLEAFCPAPGFAGAIASPVRGWLVEPSPTPWLHQDDARAS